MSRWFRVMWKINQENFENIKNLFWFGWSSSIFQSEISRRTNFGRNNDDNMLISLLFFHFYFLPLFHILFRDLIFSICSLNKERAKFQFFIRQKAAAVEDEAEAIAVISLCTQLCALICIWNSTCDDDDENFYFLTFSIHFWTFFHRIFFLFISTRSRRIKSRQEWEWHDNN